MKFFKGLAVLLLIIGGLNWGSIAVFHYDFVVHLLAGVSHGATITQTLYILIGVAALYVGLLGIRGK
jgi:uncharacterized membrane protein YuzA (DUF378 family)